MKLDSYEDENKLGNEEDNNRKYEDNYEKENKKDLQMRKRKF